MNASLSLDSIFQVLILLKLWSMSFAMLIISGYVISYVINAITYDFSYCYNVLFYDKIDFSIFANRKLINYPLTILEKITIITFRFFSILVLSKITSYRTYLLRVTHS